MTPRNVLVDQLIDGARAQVFMPGALFAEAWSSDPVIQQKWEKLGFLAVFPYNERGIFYDENERPVILMGTDSELPYGIAANSIQETYTDDHDETLFIALSEMLYGTFEESGYVQYLPRQNY